MKLSDGLTRLWPVIGIFIFYTLSFAALSLVVKRMDISVAYAVWAGLGTALIVIVGVFSFNEPVTWLRIACVGLIIAGVIGLNLSGASH